MLGRKIYENSNVRSKDKLTHHGRQKPACGKADSLLAFAPTRGRMGGLVPRLSLNFLPEGR